MKTFVICVVLVWMVTGCQTFNEFVKDYDPFLYGNPWSK